ncbi:hypothetical protein HFD88_000895 [Aspergillus terreus]|uniref:Nonribisomal peptide synthetase benY n=1 Tax=Aspergillus terreus TaxID=33178 RepID=BENY_ASPTE|nr:RecName: Full=Nonribisomal peptide synthetase benY; Short=NRPS benY; AltName: Full=Benzomalvin biosynthesis cluster protein Y [Aspergillus terreus]AQM58288.1 non-ribosomal peptide synthase [Shuttle vector AtFAC9J20]KAG2417796.1 hypothetical protein HFD88_000895 [Aspergillus terreus]
MVSRKPALAVKELGCISDRDLRQLQRWNLRAATPATDQLMHEIIHQRALEFPEKIAVEAWNGTFTYQQLDRLASHLASCLASRGIGSNDFVPISFHKSRWAIVAMLAVNKSGAAFVPVDPSLPAGRVIHILRQTEARVALACDKRSTAMSEAGISVITVADSMDCEHLDKPLWSPSFPGHNAPAYCLFTSGSTGEPKGCVVGHAAFASIASHSQSAYIHSGSRVLQFASLGFGMGLFEVFCTLSTGATLCIPSDEDRMNCLAHAMTSMNVTWTILSPTTLSTLSPADMDCLVTVVTGGEPLSESQVTVWAPHVRLLQLYGLTECSGMFTVSDQIFSSDNPERNIGYPISGRCWIADPQDHHRLRAIGAVGELLIDTPNLAQNYLHNPAKTAAAFISPPGWIEDQLPARQSRPAVLYKTGDLARFNLDGSICHLGRKDHQLKVRGQRVEPGELEHHLRQLFPAVGDVVVDMACPVEANGVASLTAFILQENECSDDLFVEPTEAFLECVQSVRQSLTKIVPAYMIPNLFLRLGTMPKTVSGKKDRRRLRQEVGLLTWDRLRKYMTVDNARGRAAHTLETESEKILAQIWADLLHLDVGTLGPEDDILALGADSITAMRAVAMARIRGLGLTVSDIFATPTLAEMAQSARVVPTTAVTTHRSVSLVDDNVRELCLSHLREQTSLLDSDEQTPLILPATGMQKFFLDRSSFDYFAYILDGDVDFDRMQAACTTAVNQHSILRTVFVQNASGIFQVTLSSIPTALYHITTARNVADVSEKLWSPNTSKTVTLDHPATRFMLVSNPDAQQHALILRLSHSQYDGLSWPNLVGAIAATYNGSALSPCLQFSDYIRCRYQQDTTAGYNFWRRYLLGYTPTHMRDCTFEATTQSKAVSTDSDAVNVHHTIPSPPDTPDGITMATLIKAAGALVLGQLTRRPDIVIGQTVHGRSSLPLAGIETILGPCLNFVPIHVQIHPTWTAERFLHHVQDSHIQTTAYDYLELADIIEQSTSWAPGTSLGAIFHHQNIDTKMEISLQGMKNSKTIHHLTGSYIHQQMRSEVWVYSMPVDQGLEISIRGSSHVISAPQADELARKLGAFVQTLARHPEQALVNIMAP